VACLSFVARGYAAALEAWPLAFCCQCPCASSCAFGAICMAGDHGDAIWLEQSRLEYAVGATPGPQ